MERLEELKVKYQPQERLRPANRLYVQSAQPNQDVTNLVWSRIQENIQRFHGSDLFQRIIEAFRIPAA
jgi:hypothetical protein